jgi:cytochrome c-type biogenesis protein CcmH/NrfF
MSVARLIPLLLFALAAPLCAQQYSAEVETAAAKIFNTAMSPFCPGRTIATCPSSQAADLKAEIRAMLADGVSLDSVERMLLARYGEVVRAAPEARGFGLLAWVVPGLVLVVVGAWITVRLSRLRPSSGPDAEAAVDPVAELDADGQARVDRELSQL